MKSIFNLKKFVAAILTFLFIMQQTMVLPVLAESNISGVTNGGSGSFDIHPQVANGDLVLDNIMISILAKVMLPT